MFFSFTDWLDSRKNLSRIHIGKVVENDSDPSKLGGVKVEIEGLLEGPVDGLPLVRPFFNPGLGASSKTSWFSVPEVDTYVLVEFIDDIYSGVYVGIPRSESTMLPLKELDYPYTYGFADSTSNNWIINKKQEYFEFQHSSGSRIQFTKDGDIAIWAERDFRVGVGRDFVTDVRGETKSKHRGKTSQKHEADLTINVAGNTSHQTTNHVINSVLHDVTGASIILNGMIQENTVPSQPVDVFTPDWDDDFTSDIIKIPNTAKVSK